MKHGEQLAPLIEAVLADAGVVRQDLTAIAVGVGPGTVHRAPGRAGHRAHAGLRARAPRVRRVLARRARGRGSARPGGDRERLRGGHRRAAQGGLPRVVRRRRAPARRTRRAPAGRRRDRAARSSGEGAVLYPAAFPDLRGPELPSAGWLARVVAEELRRAARPRAALPAPPRRDRARGPEEGVVTVTQVEVRSPVPTTPRRWPLWSATSSAPTPGRRARRRGCRGTGPDHALPRGHRGRRARRATPRSASSPTSPSCSGSRWRRPTDVRGLASGLLGRVEHEALTRHADRLLLEVREDNHVACAFYAARGFTEIDRRPRYYADGTTAVILAQGRSR